MTCVGGCGGAFCIVCAVSALIGHAHRAEFCSSDGGIGGKTVSPLFENGYTDIIDQAITNVSLGAEGYQSAIRNVLKTVGEGSN